MDSKKSRRKTRKQLVAFRFRDVVIKTLQSLKKRTGKSKTRVMEEAILTHAKELL